jgi:hypothetical protein
VLIGSQSYTGNVDPLSLLDMHCSFQKMRLYIILTYFDSVTNCNTKSHSKHGQENNCFPHFQKSRLLGLNSGYFPFCASPRRCGYHINPSYETRTATLYANLATLQRIDELLVIQGRLVMNIRWIWIVPSVQTSIQSLSCVDSVIIFL